MNLEEISFYHTKSRHYFECHITIDVVLEEEVRDRLNKAAEIYGFRLAKLNMQSGAPSELDTFLTGGANSILKLKHGISNLVEWCKLEEIKVRRIKIEDVIWDTKFGDVV